MGSQSQSTRWLIGIGGAVAATVLLSVVVIALAGGEQEFAPDTPEGTVQRYLRAVQDRDDELVLSLLTDETRERCEGNRVRDALRGFRDRDIRVRLDDVRGEDDAREVRVRIREQRGNSPFDDGYEHEQLLDLMREHGEWRIDGQPWPLFCVPPHPVRTAVPEISE